jgi:hypothetical protein
MKEPDHEARRERREREREAGVAFTRVLREHLEADRIPLEGREESDESPEDGDGDGAWMLMEGQTKGVA